MALAGVEDYRAGNDKGLSDMPLMDVLEVSLETPGVPLLRQTNRPIDTYPRVLYALGMAESLMLSMSSWNWHLVPLGCRSF